jgi:broad specificity phosphatase PhoE
MAFRLTLLRCAGTRTAREGGFADPDEPLDEGGARLARIFRLSGAEPASIACSPARAARQTIALMRLAGEIEPALADIDHGSWRGRSFEDVQRAEPEGFSAWLASSEGGAPDGETMDAVRQRVSAWLGKLTAETGHAVAVTHPMIIRAVLCETVGMPAAVAQRIDIAPLGCVVLSRNRAWRLQELTRP